jgi:ATP-dependent helicase/nuclease subunit B
MARLRLVRADDPRVLLEAAAAGFLEPPRGAVDTHGRTPIGEPFPSPDYLLVLRQGGLRDDLIRLAAERGVAGWFDPPLCLFQQLHEWLGQTDRAACGDYERVVLLSRLVRESRTQVFSRRPAAFVDALDRLFGELIAEGVAPVAFAAALEARTGRDEFEAARDGDLGALYDAYHATLSAAGRRDGRDRLIDCAQAVRAEPAALVQRLGGRRQIRILGLQDLRGGWRPLLDALRTAAGLDEIAIYTCVALDADEGLMPDDVEWAEPTRTAPRWESRADGQTAGHAPGRPIRLISSADPGREIEAVAEQVRRLIDGGATPERVAVISRSARPYAERLITALSRYGVPATARRRYAFAEIPAVRAVLALFAVAADGWTRHGLVELAEQPYFGRLTAEGAPARRLDAVVINHIGYKRRTIGLDAWIEQHRSLRDAARQREARIAAGEEEERSGRDTPPPAARVEDALAAFQSFADRVHELERSRPPGEWVAWLRAFIEADPWRIESQLYRVPEDRWDVARVDAAGWRGMHEILRQWEAALEAWPAEDGAIDVAAFESRLREMLSGDAALWTRVRRGVQVVEALAAAQRSFDHVFLVGLSSDEFPRRSPRSPILDERDRVQLASSGIPLETRETWERRELELFRVLLSAATGTLTLSWPRSDAEGRRLSPSIFIDEAANAVDGTVAATPENAASAAAGPGSALEPGTVADFPLDRELLGLLAGGAGDVRAIRLESSTVVAASLALIDDAEAREQAAHAVRIERIRLSREPSPWNGRIEDPALLEWLGQHRLGETTFTWSATQLEAYAKCPWSWFSQRLLRLDDVDDPDIDMDPLVRGTILHEALSQFYQAARAHVGGPVFLRESDRPWALPLVESALMHAFRVTGSHAWLGAPALRRTKEKELERMLSRYIEWEIDLNEKQCTGHYLKKRILRTGADRHEFTFGHMREGDAIDDIVLDLAGVRFLLRGSIDRVDRGVDERIAEASEYVAAIDYKTSKWSTPGAGDKDAWDEGVVLQVPLYAHVLERLIPGARVSRVEYRSIKQREAVHSLELYQILANGDLVEDAEKREQMDFALEAAGRHVARARAGEFPASPPPSCACPPYCHAWDICRVAGGPRTKW